MNGARLHMILLHLPIAASAIAVVFLLLGELFKWPSIVKGGWALLLVGALGAAGAYYTGEAAEDVLGAAAEEQEEAFGDAQEHVHEHEEWGEWAFYGAIATGAAAAALLFATRKSAGGTPEARLPGARWARTGLFLLALGTTGVVLKTASLGGEIRHSEIRIDAEPESTSAK